MQRHPEAVVVQPTAGKNPQVSFLVKENYNLGLLNPKAAPPDCSTIERLGIAYSTPDITNIIQPQTLQPIVLDFWVEIFISEISWIEEFLTYL